MRTATERQNELRRTALRGNRHTVVFYGAWFVVDARNATRTVTAKTLDDALSIAERRNDNEGV